MKGFFFGPEYKADVIQLANTAVFDSTLYDDIDQSINNTNAATRVIAQPGLLANNSPTVYSSLNVVQARAVAIISAGAVTDIVITESGVGYAAATVTIDGNATATAEIGSADNIDRIVITDGGSGYTETPTVTISAPDLESIANTAAIDSESNYGDVSVIQGPYPDEG